MPAGEFVNIPAQTLIADLVECARLSNVSAYSTERLDAVDVCLLAHILANGMTD